ncbi:hypothetical protein E4U41_003325 [Claviceps citrina]|nr:hypothetical protein E4U41_003325 [Claviceps citrina]
MPILGWLKKQPPPGAADVDTSGWDEYPVHLLDGSKLNHKVLGWTMRFDDVLDADMLHSALTKLLGVGDWRKLGGRLRRDKKDQLRIYAPPAFSAAHPAVEYQHTVFPQAISSHPVGALFIRPTEQPTAQPLDRQLGGFMAPEGYPDTVDGLVQSRNKSQLALTVSSFHDATLVSLAFPHTLLDASGLVALVQNWSLVLAGGEVGEVAPLLNTRHDVLEDVTRDDDGGGGGGGGIAPRDCRMEKMRLTGFAYLKLLGRHMAEAAQRKRRLQALYVPRDRYQALLARLRDDGPEDGHEDGTGDAGRAQSRVTDVHLLTAWLVRIIAAQESCPRPVALITLYDLRSCIQRLKDARAQGRGGHISQILVSSYCATFSADTLRDSSSTGSVAALAKAYQEQTAALTAEDEAIAHLKVMRGDLRTEKKPGSGFALYGTADSLVVFCNPLAGMGLVRMADFAAAVKEKRKKENGTGTGTTPTSTAAGRIVANVFHFVDWSDAGVDALSLLGEDHEGGCWVMAKLSSGVWDRVLGEL